MEYYSLDMALLAHHCMAGIVIIQIGNWFRLKMGLT
jgi:hypothetical protein